MRPPSLSAATNSCQHGWHRGIGCCQCLHDEIDRLTAENKHLEVQRDYAKWLLGNNHFETQGVDTSGDWAQPYRVKAERDRLADANKLLRETQKRDREVILKWQRHSMMLTMTLRGLYDDVAEYQRLNKLDAYNNHWMIAARAALNNTVGIDTETSWGKVSDEMVSRFLAWKLPTDFRPDGGITFIPTSYPGPTGTNLLSFDQAKAMLEHVIGQPCAPHEDNT